MAENSGFDLFSSFNGFLCQNGGSVHSARRLSEKIEVHTYAHIVYRTTIINYAKFEEMTERDVVYVTKMKKNLRYEVLVDCMHQEPQGLMAYREQVVVFRKDNINHIARIISYVDIKRGKQPKLISLLTNDFDMSLETICPYTAVAGRSSLFSSRSSRTSL